jgi:hypothetical protein
MFYTAMTQAYTDSCALHCSEAAMQKSITRSFPEKKLPGNDLPPQLNNLFESVRPSGGSPKEITREDVSRCINIWAKMYRLNDEDSQPSDLCMPSRTWIGRSPDKLKRFD